MRIRDWSSDVWSSDLAGGREDVLAHEFGFRQAGFGAVGLLAPPARVLGMGVAFADALVVPDEGLVHLHKHVDGGNHAQQHQQYTKHDDFLLIGRSGATIRRTKAGPGARRRVESGKRLSLRVGLGGGGLVKKK